jgi:hypothetical protein
MARKHPAPIPNRLHIRFLFPDGRASTLCCWADGEWKVEIFGSIEHAEKFAKENNMEIVRHDDLEAG